MLKQTGMLLGSLALVVIVVAVTVLWNPFSASSERMSENEAIDKVQKLYPGAISNAELDGDVYRLQLVSDLGKYDLAVDSRKGNIVSIEQVEKGKGNPENPDQTGQQPGTHEPDNTGADQGKNQNTPPSESGGKGSDSTPEDSNIGEDSDPETPPMRMITKEYAKKVSLAKVPGTVEDIEYRDEDDGSRYYLVEIEKSNGKEATIQVNAITGKIMTITWDD